MNNKCCRFKGKMVTLTIAFLLSLLLCKGALAGNWERNPDLTIGWTAWSDAEVISKMAVIILSRAMNYDVELTLADISVQYRGVAEGDLDAMLMSWQPRTHAEYLERYKDQLVDLGPLYENTTLGLVVPDYMAESGVNSIADLAKPAVKNRFQGKIQGIGATAGLMKLSRQALDAYQLDYTLVTSSGPAMAKRLGEALQNQSPIVATGWRPHWIFAEYPIQYLQDPKGIFESRESVHAIVRKGFAAEYPEVAGFLRRMHLELDELEKLMVKARKTSHTEAILEWIGNNRDRVKFWINGQ